MTNLAVVFRLRIGYLGYNIVKVGGGMANAIVVDGGQKLLCLLLFRWIFDLPHPDKNLKLYRGWLRKIRNYKVAFHTNFKSMCQYTVYWVIFRWRFKDIFLFVLESVEDKRNINITAYVKFVVKYFVLLDREFDTRLFENLHEHGGSRGCKKFLTLDDSPLTAYMDSITRVCEKYLLLV